MKFEVVLVAAQAAIFALFAFFRFDCPPDVRVGIAAFIFAAYCGTVAVSTWRRRRSISLSMQAGLGACTAVSMTGVFGAPLEGYAVAALVGLILGYFADLWVVHVQLP